MKKKGLHFQVRVETKRQLFNSTFNIQTSKREATDLAANAGLSATPEGRFNEMSSQPYNALYQDTYVPMWYVCMPYYGLKYHPSEVAEVAIKLYIGSVYSHLMQDISAPFHGDSVRYYEYRPTFVPEEISQKFKVAGESFLHLNLGGVKKRMRKEEDEGD
ncbi:hypothetical protein RJT34_00027 [Clitoria ternatea]|uniref:Uncharacterized protein n=1 Tax=Clitoria ternatea TaxID=43366 RepID=A0AAN9KEU0_CLITE